MDFKIGNKSKKDMELVFGQVLKGLGFVPNSIYAMGQKPNILGSFSLLMANIRGFSGTKTSTWTGIRLFFKNMGWMIKAKRNAHQEVPLYLKSLVAHVSSNASGCRYCQAHTAYEAHHNGVAIEKLQNMWEFQTSPLFTEKEKAALSFGFAAGAAPNQVGPGHFEELRKHFSKEQVIELMSVIAVFGFLNRWNDSMATELESAPLLFAEQYLPDKWAVGKHKK